MTNSQEQKENCCDEELHKVHHQWIGVQRDKESRRVELWLKVKESTISSLVTSAVIGLLTLAWWGVTHFLGGAG